MRLHMILLIQRMKRKLLLLKKLLKRLAPYHEAIERLKAEYENGNMSLERFCAACSKVMLNVLGA